jgi:hypothetical protein
MKKMFLGLLVGGLALVSAGPAQGATVSVQIEGAGQILVPLTVQTPAAPVKHDGTNACDAATALGALDAAVGGNWTGPYSSFGGVGTYSPYVIRGESHPFDSAFWSVWVNNQFQNQGFCQTTVKDGDEVLIYAADNDFVAGIGGYDTPLVLTVPAAISPGVPFVANVKVTSVSYDASFTGTTTSAPAAGAVVQAGGVSGTTNAGGDVTLTVTQAGPLALTAVQGNHAPDRTTRCATTGTDGFCDVPAPAPAACATSGDDGRCGSADKRAAYGFVTSIKNAQKFAKGKGPRELKGRIDDEPSGIADVRLRLTRTDKGACSAYDAVKERLVTTKKCGVAGGTWFSAGTAADWTYLLPARLGRGRYVLDVQVTDKAGNVDDQPARGRNRVVFTVA